MGLRAVPPIREPAPLGFDPRADLLEDPERADGGRAVLEEAVDAVDAVLEPRLLAETDFTGE